MMNYRKTTLVFCGYVLAVLLQYLPMLPNLDSTFSGGIDSRYFLWLMEHAYRSMGEPIAFFFSAPILYPNLDVILYSETQYFITLCYLPLRFITHHPVIAYNILQMLMVAITAFTAHLFIRRCTGSHGAGLIAGLFMAYSPVRQMNYGHTYKHCLFWMIMIIWSLDSLFTRQRRRDAAAFTVAFIGNALVSWYYGLIGALIVAVQMIFILITGHKTLNRKTVSYLLIAILLIALVLVPLANLNYRVLHDLGIERSLASLKHQSYTMGQFFSWRRNSLPARYLPDFLPKENPGLFPGFTIALLMLMGLWHASRWRWLALGLLVSSTYIAVGLHYPYSGMEYALTLVRRVAAVTSFGRALSLFTVVTFISAAWLAALGWMRLVNRFHLSAPRRRLLLTVLAGLIILENMNVSIPLAAITAFSRPAAVYEYLAALPDRHPVIELPARRSTDQEKKWTGDYLVNQHIHRHPLFNGWNSFTPQPQQWANEFFDSLDSRIQVVLLSACGVRYAVLHKTRTSLRSAAPFQRIWEDDNDILYAVPAQPFNKPGITLEIPLENQTNQPLAARFIFDNNSDSWCALLGDQVDYFTVTTTFIDGELGNNETHQQRIRGFFLIPPRRQSFLELKLPSPARPGIYHMTVDLAGRDFSYSLQRSLPVHYLITQPGRYRLKPLKPRQPNFIWDRIITGSAVGTRYGSRKIP